MSLDEAAALRAARSRRRTSRARPRSIVAHVRAMLAMQQRGAVTFDYGNNIRTVAFDAGVANAFDIPGLRPGVHPAAVLRREGTVPLGRAVGRSEGHRAHRRAGARAVSATTRICAAGSRWRASGFTSRDCRRASAGWGRASARSSASRSTISSRAASSRRRSSIGRDHLDTGSVASPFRETEAMKDGTDAVADWPILNALLNVASGAIVGVVPSRRRRRHRQLAARRAGDRRRRHAGDARATRARADERSRASASRATPTPATRRATRDGARAAGYRRLPMRRRRRRAFRALQAVARSAVPREVRLAHGATAAGARALRGHAALQRALRLLRLLEDRPAERATDELKSLRRRGAVLQSDARHLHRRRADCCAAISRSSSPQSIAAIALKYVTLITHGGMLTAERAQSLWDAGINQFNISLDYLDERHDRRARHSRARRDGSSTRFRAMRARGIDNIRFNTVIKDDNLDQLLPIVERAAELGVRRELQRLHRREERQSRRTCSATPSTRELDDVDRASCSRSSGDSAA